MRQLLKDCGEFLCIAVLVLGAVFGAIWLLHQSMVSSSKQNVIKLENVDWTNIYTVYIVRRDEERVDIFVDESERGGENVTTRHLATVLRSHLKIKVPLEIPVEFK